MNTQLVESLVQTIRALSAEERALFNTKLYGEVPYPSHLELAHLSEHGTAFDFLKDEPDLYSITDGEAIEALLNSGMIWNEVSNHPTLISSHRSATPQLNGNSEGGCCPG